MLQQHHGVLKAIRPGIPTSCLVYFRDEKREENKDDGNNQNTKHPGCNASFNLLYTYCVLGPVLSSFHTLHYHLVTPSSQLYKLQALYRQGLGDRLGDLPEWQRWDSNQDQFDIIILILCPTVLLFSRAKRTQKEDPSRVNPVTAQKSGIYQGPQCKAIVGKSLCFSGAIYGPPPAWIWSSPPEGGFPRV